MSIFIKERKVRCPQCQRENSEAARFCEECGTKLMRPCPGCGHEVSPRAKFCPECGRGLPETSRTARFPSPQGYTPPHLAERIRVEQAALEARATPDGERKTITALFADIQGSMELIEELDPEEARHLIDPALKLMMEAVHRYEGYVAQSMGDGIFALFGAPIAHEDHPQRALYAALKMQEEARRYAERLRREKGVNLQLRVGVNTGEVVVRSIRKDDLHTDYVPIGHSTSLAARMERLATPGSILVSGHTHRLTEGYFEFKPLGEAQVKGVSEPVPIYEMVGIGPLRTRLQVAAWRGLVRFVGRQGELEQMRRALELAQGGHGQIVAVVGEPGVGKSRLCYEFKQTSPRGCRVLETFSISHGKASAYLPLMELLKGYFEVTFQDDERRVQERVTGKVLTLDRSLEETLPFLSALLGVSEQSASLQQMDPQVRRRRTFEAIKRLLLRESLSQPLLILFEDLHWLDNESQAFLDLLAESIATARILLLVNYRLEYRHAWGRKSYYTQLRLDPLGPREAKELLTALVGDGRELQELKQRILEKTQGNPFFLEEIIQALFDQGVLARGAGVSLTRPLTEVQLPPTVQGVLASRIDRLPAEEKELLQTLAVLGKEFSFSLLKEVVDRPEEERYRLLSHLQEREFIYEQAMALYDPRRHRSLAFLCGGFDPGLHGRYFAAFALWAMGYPDRARERIHNALSLAGELSHPHSLAFALTHAAILDSFRREWQAAQEQAKAIIALSTEQGFPFWLAVGTILQGRALAAQGQAEEGIAQMHQGLAAWRATGAELIRPYFLGLLAEAYGKGGQAQEGLVVLEEALAAVRKSGERFYEAELYRLKGELLLALSAVNEAEAEACFHQALDIARRQGARSWELRAMISLSRLWQGQGKNEEARQRLAEIYGWFTEGLDTPDLTEAKRLLEEMP